MVDAKLRPALKSDAADLALLDNIAGNGISLWYWNRVTGSSQLGNAFVLGRTRLADENAIYGWKNSDVIVDEDDCVLGAISHYINPEQDEDIDAVKHAAPVFAPVFELFSEVVGHWLIDSLAVFPEARGQGHGNTMLVSSLGKARDASVSNASLVVEDSNDAAIALYKKFGFKHVAQREFLEFDGPAKTKFWHLMTAEL